MSYNPYQLHCITQEQQRELKSILREAKYHRPSLFDRIRRGLVRIRHQPPTPTSSARYRSVDAETPAEGKTSGV